MKNNITQSVSKRFSTIEVFKINQKVFNLTIDHFLKFAKEIFSPNGKDEFKIKLIETLDQIMKMDKHLTTTQQQLQNEENMDPNSSEQIKLDHTLDCK